MSDILQLTKIDVRTAIIILFTILVGWKAIIALKDWYFDRFGIETKGMKKRREEHELLISTADGLKTVTEQMTNAYEKIMELSHDHDEAVEKSIECDEALKDQIQVLSNDFHVGTQELKRGIINMRHEIDERFEMEQQRSNERVQAEMKDRIGQLYRYYHTTGKISDMELEALKDLITSYENHGGENSFVHTIVQPEMYTWEKI